MVLVVVERSFETEAAFDAVFDTGNSCLALYNVRFLRSYGSPDKKRMMCLYDAPDAESVRQANRQGGKPFDRAWTAEPHGRPER